MAEIETAQTKTKVNDTSSLNEAYTVNQNYNYDMFCKVNFSILLY